MAADAPLLSEILESKRDDMTSFVREEMEAARGLSGAVLRASWETVERIRPGLLERAVSELSPRLAEALEPIYRDALRSRAPLEDAFEARAHEVAEVIVRVTDERVGRVRSELVRGTYARVRSSVRSRLVDAAPKLGRLVAG